MKEVDGNLIAVVRIRGEIGINPDIRDCLNLMKLHRKHRLIITQNTSSMRGMINKVKDYCTFGEIDATTVEAILTKRAKLPGNKDLTEEYVKKTVKSDIKSFSKALSEDLTGVKTFFKLHPPIGGFERLGIKKPYARGGSLGYRSKDMSKLVMKML
jgi:large subunit ribosomal protein L30